MEDGDITEDDYTAVRIKNLTVVSTYFSPNITTDLFAYKSKSLMQFINKERSKGNSIILGGDFNAKSPAWGSKEQNLRGNILLEDLLGNNIFPCTPQGGHTFERGNSTSNLDFVAISQDLLNKKYDISSKILNAETASDHKYIFTVIKTLEDGPGQMITQGNRWKITRAGITRLGTALEKLLREQEINQGDTYNQDEKNKFLDCMFKSCDEALDKADAISSKEKGNAWWTPEIRKERNKTQRLRRATQKARKKGKTDEREALTFLYKLAKKNLQRLISKSKEKVWKELCESIDKDIWGKPYKVVIRQVKNNNPPASLSSEFAATVMKGLFPQENNLPEDQDRREVGPEILPENPEASAIPDVTIEEVLIRIK